HSPASRALAAATGAPVLGFGPHPPADAAHEACAGSPADPSLRRRAPQGDQWAVEGSDAAPAAEEPADLAFIPDGLLAHGDVLAGDGWTLECLHTPGHISNHLCFALPEERAVFTGDHVMGWSSTIIPPPDGNLGDYLRSLELLIARGDRDEVYWPTHGPAITAPNRYARALLAHRHRRTDQILACLADGPTSIPELVARMYTTTPETLRPAAALSVLAHIIHLTEQGHVTFAPAAHNRTRRYSLT
ncbi:MAG: MBL fold metallo-hydrolase, partial [Acidimicrobiia bacterium]|nr:MBL fold metallo-hydrolase [Acidimicrobiia bacterium]